MNNRLENDNFIDSDSVNDVYTYEISPDSGADSCREQSRLQHCMPGNRRRHGISNIASGTYYVHRDVMLEDLVDDMNRHSTLLAVGVVGDDDEAQGIIIRRELFNILGRSYGDEFSRSRTAASIARHVRTFHYESSIFSVAAEIEEELMGDMMQYFMLVNGDGKFTGIFSTKDILVSLAGMTRRDMDAAAAIQAGIVNDRMILREQGFELTAAANMAGGVGGDFYSVKKIHDQHWFIAIADVSGKGVGAAFLTAVLGALVHTYDFRKGMKNFLIKLNEYIDKTFSNEKFLTGLFCTLDEAKGLLNVYDMGHSLIYIYREGRMLKLKSPHDNFPVGISSEISPLSGNISLQRGDLIIMITDGVLEQFNSLREEYGFSRLATVIHENRDRTTEEIKKCIIDDLDKFRGFEPRHDDVTFILIKFTGHPDREEPD